MYIDESHVAAVVVNQVAQVCQMRRRRIHACISMNRMWLLSSLTRLRCSCAFRSPQQTMYIIYMYCTFMFTYVLCIYIYIYVHTYKPAQFVRVQLSSTDYLSLAEVEVWGFSKVEPWKHLYGMKRWTQVSLYLYPILSMNTNNSSSSSSSSGLKSYYSMCFVECVLLNVSSSSYEALDSAMQCVFQGRGSKALVYPFY
jgi:uncharacterized membrane protein YcgQ (UPF0703/DUF1980 family)